MIGHYEYPCIIELDPNGGFLTRFPDIPEAINGAETPARLTARATDALITALNFCVEMGEPIPVPSIAAEKQATIAAPPLVAAKLSLYEIMIERGVTSVDLAHRLDCDESSINRLLDLHRRCDIQSIDDALTVLGRRVVVSVQPAE